MLYRCAALLCLIIHSINGHCQVEKKIRQYERTFQFSLLPGISTNGIYSGSYYNKFSLNLFGDSRLEIKSLNLVRFQMSISKVLPEFNLPD